MKPNDTLKLTLAYLLIAAAARPRREEVRAAEASALPKAAKASWVQTAQAIFVKIDKDRVLAVAAGLTFYSLLAIFPAITALVSIYGLFADPHTIQSQLTSLSGVIPDGALSIVGDQIQRIISQGSGALSFAFITGLAIALWSANSGVKALFDALNVANEAKETRSFLRLNAITLLFTLSGMALAIVFLAATVVAPLILQLVLPEMAFTAALIRWTGVAVAIVVVGLLLAVVYHFGPAERKPAWRWITPGSVFAVVFLIVASAAFAYYTSHFGNYNKTYGTLGAAIGFMTWLWISSIVVLVGAEINAEIARRATGSPQGFSPRASLPSIS